MVRIPSLLLVDLSAFPAVPEVEEDGDTFQANARKKAVETSLRTGCWTLADDSGLEVDALGGAPGVRSARYAGEPVDYAANNAKLLRELGDRSDRRARFRCVIALAEPGGEVRTVEGRCEGSIARAEHGRNGFGYDPLFIPDGYTVTFADMAGEQKNRISHRAAALRAAAGAWHALLARPE